MAILLCRPDRVGDVVIATSCLAAVREQLWGEQLFFAAREHLRPLLEGHPALDGFISLPDSSSSPAPAARHALAARLREAGIDRLVMLHPDALIQRAAVEAGVARRIGYRHSFRLDRTLTERLPDRRHAGERHEAEHNFDALAPLGIRPPPPAELRPSVHLPESWRRSLRLRLAAIGFEDFDAPGEENAYAVLNPTAHSLEHRWAPEHWTWLAMTLRERTFSRVFLVGPSVDDPSSHAVRHRLGPGFSGVVDLSGQTNLAELGWLLRSARVFVSRNTGSTHLAAAVGCPTVELFGRLEPAYGPGRWRALGGRTRSVHAAPGGRGWLESRRAWWRRGYTTIPREAVLAATLELAAKRSES